ncbi:MAG: oligosaccharide flippase family protein [Leptolyngbya sp. SIO3F4]|nr:oligosaccharide flippase family protein [Leptolyngbya sp. SIO3F4]
MYDSAGSISLIGLVNKIALKGDYFIVSKFLGPSSLGLYSKAYQLMAMPTTLVSKALNKIGFATLAEYQDDREIQRLMFLRLTFLVSMILFPISVVLFFLAEEIIYILLGPAWMEATVAFQILSIGSFFRLAYKISDVILQVKRKFNVVLFIHTAYAAMVLVGAFLLREYNIEGVAVGVLLALVTEYILSTALSARYVGLSFNEIILAIYRPVLITLVLVLLILGLQQIPIFSTAGNVAWIAVFLASVITAVIGLRLKGIGGEYGRWWWKKIRKRS